MIQKFMDNTLTGSAAFAIAVAITSVLIVVTGHDPLEVFSLTWQGSFRDLRSLSTVINLFIPIVLVSMGLIVTFRGGWWNIGIEGQITAGAIFASWGALNLSLPPIVLVPAEIMLAMIGGALWALLSAVLKTKFNMHEIFSGVALNALANILAVYLISGPWQPPEGGGVHSTPLFPESARLPPLSSEFNVSLVSFGMAIASIAVVVLIVNKSHWGLALKATGSNARSAYLLGTNINYTAISAFLFAGALAGTAGAHRVLFTYGSLRPLASGGIGFLGLLIVLLVSNRVLFVPFAAFGFAAIMAGSTRLKVSLQIDPSLANSMQGILVLAGLLVSGIRRRLHHG